MEYLGRKTLFGLALLMASCVPGTPSEIAETTSELPIRGTWRHVGTAVFELEAPEEQQSPFDPTDPGEPITSEEMDQLAQADLELKDGHVPILVADNGDMFRRVDLVDRAGRGTETESFLQDGELNPGEVEAEIEKSVFGSDTRTLWGYTRNYPARAHVALRNGANASSAFCSGAMIGPRHVLTAGHCFHKDGRFTKSRSNVRVIWGQDGSGNSASNTPFGKSRVVAWVFPNGWVNHNNYRYDYGLLILEDSGYSPGWLGFAAYGYSTLQSLNVNINGYPGHSHDCAASPLSSGVCGGYLYHGYGKINMVFSSTLYTKVDWQSGQSGSPVYRYYNGKRRVVGVVSRHGPLWNKATRLRSGVFDALCDWIGDFPSGHFGHDCY